MSYKLLQRMTDEEIVNRVIYRDALIIVLNKPSGIGVHPANGSHHNLEQYFSLLQFGLKRPPVLAHRLDLGTSGCLVLARHPEAARKLQLLFSEGLIKKTYYALVEGEVKNDEGRIDIPLSKQSPLKKHWWMKADPEGKISAITDFRVKKRSEKFSMLELSPITGRTHQLRVHCAAIGHPIVGDYIYGSDPMAARQEKLCLHAQTIVLPIYKNKAPLSIEAPLPEHFSSLHGNF